MKFVLNPKKLPSSQNLVYEIKSLIGKGRVHLTISSHEDLLKFQLHLKVKSFMLTLGDFFCESIWNLRTLSLETHFQEDLVKKKMRKWTFEDPNILYSNNGEKIEIPINGLTPVDFLSALFFLQAQELRPGAKFNLDLLSSKTIKPLTVEFTQSDRIGFLNVKADLPHSESILIYVSQATGKIEDIDFKFKSFPRATVQLIQDED